MLIDYNHDLVMDKNNTLGVCILKADCRILMFDMNKEDRVDVAKFGGGAKIVIVFGFIGSMIHTVLKEAFETGVHFNRIRTERI